MMKLLSCWRGQGRYVVLVSVLGGWCGLVQAQPRLPTPTLKGVMAENLVARARVRWSKVVDGQRVEVIIGAGTAERMNPQWSPGPAHLQFGIDRNRELEAALKKARGSLGAPAPANLEPSKKVEDRTLEILAQGPDGWMVVGRWSMPLSRWRKQQGPLFRLLEPLFDAQADTFVNSAGR